MEGAAREIMLLLIAPDIVGMRQSMCRKNREILCELLPQKPLELIIPHQTHSTNIGVIDDACIRANKENRLEDIDAIITELPGYCLCISTADCIPVLLYDPTKQVIAAAHAGWRGTVGKIVAKTLAVMKERYASEEKDIKACIGPGISLAAFEVGDEVYETFRTAGFDMRRIARKEKNGILICGRPTVCSCSATV